MLWILLILAALAAVYWMLNRSFNYWIIRGVKQGNPVFLLGDSWGILLRKQSFADMVDMIYNISNTARYCGFYQFLTPTLLIRDPDLIKQVTVKDFDHFLDHKTIIPEDCDPLFGKNLASLNGQKWREMRSTLSPAFTSSKMKQMFSLMAQSGDQFVQHFLRQNKEIVTVEMKNIFTRFTNDVIANTAFGIECDSLEEPENEFYLMGKETTDFSGVWKNLKFFAFLAIPQICKLFKLTLFSKEVSSFFKNLVKENIRSREEKGIVRPDMIHLLMEARKHGSIHYEESTTIPDTGFATVEESEIGKMQGKQKLELTDTDITAQALLFFFGGFESVSSVMCFMSHELAVNPDVQDTLRQEVDETLKKCNGELTYVALMNMKYMDMVVSEVLRKWPNAAGADRVCTKPYTITPTSPDEKPIYLKENDVIAIPIWALHRDPKYFPNPERFDPERFSDKNKANITPYTYLPFGAGPRNCIGSRFALLEAKTLFFYILANFEIIPVEKTQIPLVLAKNTFNLLAENGFWLGFERRGKTANQ